MNISWHYDLFAVLNGTNNQTYILIYSPAEAQIKLTESNQKNNLQAKKKVKFKS